MITRTTGSFTGASDPDIIINTGGNSGLELNGSDGNDIILDSFGLVFRGAGGQYLETAVSLDSPDYWYTNDTRENALIMDDGVPHTMVVVEPMAGVPAYFKVTVGAGQTLHFDVDASYGTTGTASSLDLIARLYNINGYVLFSSDDGAVDVGSDPFVTGLTRDPAGSWTNTSAQPIVVYIGLGPFSDAGGHPGAFPADYAFLLNLSVTGHETSANPIASLGNTIKGGLGNDILLGGAGDDVLWNEGGDDTIFGGSGNDTVFVGSMTTNKVDGGAGHDIIDFSMIDDRVSINLAEGSFAGTDTSGTVTGIEEVIGSVYMDTITGDLNDNTLYGAEGSDTLTGADGSDVLNGGSGHDALFGDGGDDDLVGGFGDDTLFGGTGRDTLDGGDGDDVMTSGDGDGDDFVGGDGWDAVTMGLMADGTLYNLQSGYYSGPGSTERRQLSSVERFTDGNGASIIITANSSYFDGSVTWVNTYFGNGGNDIFRIANLASGPMAIDGGADNDTLIIRDVDIGDGDEYVGGAGTDLVNFCAIDLTQGGAVGSVTINLTAGLITASSGTEIFTGFENLIGSSGSETIVGTAAANNLSGSGGDDEIEGGDGNDTLRGDLGNDELVGEAGADTLLGGAGDDRLRGGVGNDWLDGGAGGLDLLDGGTGDDTYVIYNANDVLFEIAGGGTDTVNANYSYTLLSNFENLTLTGTVGLSGTGNALDNAIRGTAFGDTLVGLDGADLLFGNDGADNLYGGNGNDALRGGDQNDVLRGGSGADKLYGNAGVDRMMGDGDADIFFFAEGDTGSTAVSADTIGDFVRADGDRISLAAIDANAALDGDQKFAFIGAGAFTGQAGELRYYSSGGQTVLEGDIDGDGMADMVIKLTGVFAMQSSDFYL